MGSIFWLTILYSLLGYTVFVLMSTVVAGRLKSDEVEAAQVKTLAAITLLVLIFSGPLSWGMVIRNTLRTQEEAS